MYFQPIENEDPHLDFYTIYNREATECDTEYMKKHNEDLNTSFIFVGLAALSVDQDAHHVLRLVCSPQSVPPSSSTSSRSSTRFRRPVGRISPCRPSQPQPVYYTCRTTYSPSCMGQSPHGDNNNLEPPTCEFLNVALGCVCCDVVYSSGNMMLGWLCLVALHTYSQHFQPLCACQNKVKLW